MKYVVNEVKMNNNFTDSDVVKLAEQRLPSIPIL